MTLVTGQRVFDQAATGVLNKKLVEDGTKGICAVHAAFVSVLEEEVTDGRGRNVCGQSTLIDQSSRQDRFSTPRTGRDPEEAGRVAVSPFTESVIAKEPLARACHPLWVEVFTALIIRGEILEEISLLLIVVDFPGLYSTVLKDPANFFEDGVRLLHLLQPTVSTSPNFLL